MAVLPLLALSLWLLKKMMMTTQALKRAAEVTVVAPRRAESVVAVAAEAEVEIEIEAGAVTETIAVAETGVARRKQSSCAPTCSATKTFVALTRETKPEAKTTLRVPNTSARCLPDKRTADLTEEGAGWTDY